MGIPTSLAASRRKADRAKIAQSRGTHVDNGWPHYSSITGLCMCFDPCCNNDQGCKCKYCPCRILGKDHSEIVC